MLSDLLPWTCPEQAGVGACQHSSCTGEADTSDSNQGTGALSHPAEPIRPKDVATVSAGDVTPARPGLSAHSGMPTNTASCLPVDCTHTTPSQHHYTTQHTQLHCTYSCKQGPGDSATLAPHSQDQPPTTHHAFHVYGAWFL